VVSTAVLFMHNKALELCSPAMNENAFILNLLYVF